MWRSRSEKPKAPSDAWRHEQNVIRERSPDKGIIKLRKTFGGMRYNGWHGVLQKTEGNSRKALRFSDLRFGYVFRVTALIAEKTWQPVYRNYLG